jgi:hypothetical protein
MDIVSKSKQTQTQGSLSQTRAIQKQQKIQQTKLDFYTRTTMVHYSAIVLLALAVSHSNAKIHEVNGGRRNQEELTTGGRRHGGRRRHGARNDGAFGGKLSGLTGSLPVDTEVVQQLAEEHGDDAVQDALYLLEGGLARSPKASLDLTISAWKDNLEASSQDCSSQQVDLPSCSWNLRGEPGVWVCRSLFNPLTGVRESRNACVHPAFSYSTIDTCGACAADAVDETPATDGETPASTIVTCTCACTSARGQTGIGISILGAIELCYPESMSNTAINTFDFVSCTECAV